ncbi:MAG: hypothetical protein EXQ52_05850 [Bryobacterales bacterium]|nr:hypothetical protein [Bryobacterales bacterium]
MADPQRTFAMVVAVNQCDAGNAWDLPESRLDALRFVTWLRDKQIPAGNISLFSGERKKPEWVSDLGGVPWARADSQNIRDRLWSYQKVEGDLLLIYWSGHGAFDGHTRDRRVMVSSMAPDRWDNLSLRALEDLLESGAFPKLRESVLFVDACSAASDGLRTPIDLPDPRKGTSPLRAICSTRPGMKGNAGFFGSVFFPVLERQNWPPDFDSVLDEVEAQCGKTRQQAATVRFKAPGKHRTYSPRAAESNRGKLLHLFCDRNTPVNNFMRSAQERINGKVRGPLLCLVHGDDEQKPESLVLRMMAEANGLWSSNSEPKQIEWDEEEELNVRCKLAHSFHREFSPIDAKQFAQVLREAAEPVVQIQHRIGALTQGRKRVFEKYLQFWRELNEEEGLPPVLVFFSMKHPPLGWRYWIPWAARARRAMEKDLDSALAAVSCFHVRPADLKPITSDDVREFLELRLLSPGSSADEIVELIFARPTAFNWWRKREVTLPMSVVERKLMKIIPELVNQVSND